MSSTLLINVPSENRGNNLLRKYLTIFFVVSAYWTISISFVFINKTLFSSQLLDLKAPIFVTWTQCIISVWICLGWKLCSKLFPNIIKFPQTKVLSPRTFKTILPVSFLFILTLGFGNLSLSFVGVPFYFISRSLTTVCNVVFTFIILKERTSKKALLACAVIVLGFLCGVDQENTIGSFSLKGTVFGVCSSLSLSLYSIYTKKVLPSVNNEVILLSFYNNLYSTLLFIPIIVFNGEYENLKAFNFSSSSYWVLTLVGGLFGFMIGFVSTLQIKITSPLTHNISGTAKACAQTVIATYWYKEVKPLLWWISNFMVLFGSAAYARVKQLEMAAKS